MKHFEIFLTFSTIPMVLAAFFMDESPRWLLARGRMKEAKEIVTKIVKMNKMPISNINLLKAEEVPKRGTLMDILRQPGMRRNFILLMVYWLASVMGFYGLSFNTPSFDWNIYLVFAFPAFISIPMSLINPTLENK